MGAAPGRRSISCLCNSRWRESLRKKKRKWLAELGGSASSAGGGGLLSVAFYRRGEEVVAGELNYLPSMVILQQGVGVQLRWC